MIKIDLAIQSSVREGWLAASKSRGGFVAPGPIYHWPAELLDNNSLDVQLEYTTSVATI